MAAHKQTRGQTQHHEAQVCMLCSNKQKQSILPVLLRLLSPPTFKPPVRPLTSRNLQVERKIVGSTV